MKKRTLLVAVVGAFLTTGVFAQTDVTPKNWKFNAMQKGSASGIFVKEAAALGGNFVSQSLGNGRKGFRYADNLEGGLSVAHWTGANDGTSFVNMTDPQKAEFEAFYNSFQVADGGKLGNILIYQGNASTETDSRAVKNAVGMVAPNIYMISQKDLGIGYYKISIPIRIILNKSANPADINVYVGDSWWNGIPLAGSGGSDYANFQLTAASEINGYWTNYQFEIQVKENTDPLFDFTPILVKLGVGGLANNAIILFDDFKIEKMANITLGGKLLADAVDWTDTPTGIVANKYKTDDVVIFANSNGIQVIDATQVIEVYTASGQLIEKVMPSIEATTVKVKDKGVYVVKTGATTRKVVF